MIWRKPTGSASLLFSPRPDGCAEELRCDFESLHTCYFTQDFLTDDMDWVLGSGRTPSVGTGPSNDHTYGNSSGKTTGRRGEGSLRNGHTGFEVRFDWFSNTIRLVG